MIESLGIQVVYFGSGLCLLQALERILLTRKILSMHLAFCLVNFIFILETGFIISGFQYEYPHSILFFFSSILLVGPVNLFYYHSLLYPESPGCCRAWLHLVPAAACLGAELVLQTQPATFKLQIINLIFVKSLEPVRLAILFAVAMHVLVYFLYILKAYQIDLGLRNLQKEFRIIGLLAMLVLVVLAMYMVSLLAGLPELFLVGSLLNVVMQICLFVGMRIYPQFFNTLKTEIRKKRYERSMLNGVDKDIVSRRINELMEDEHAYRDSEINLSSLANRLSITRHQLSEYLNEQLGTKFRDYVSRYRIDEAQNILRENGNANIMAVCFRVGFNSKSSFNTAFKKFTGLTPKEFRSRNQHFPS